MAAVRPGKKTIELFCIVCQETYVKELYEHERNERLGRASLCSRHCQAIYMDLSPAKQIQTKAMLAERNSTQWRENNPNWKGGVSGKKLKPLPTAGG